MKNEKYHTVGTVPISKRKIVKRGTIAQIQNRSLS